MASLQRLVEWFLGVPRSGPGQGTAWRFGSNFPWDSWVLLLFVLLAVVYVVVIYRRDAAALSRGARVVLITLRLTAIAVLLFMLSQAVLAIDRTGLPYAVVMLDNSGSLATPDPYRDPQLRGAAQNFLDAADFAEITPLSVGKAILIQQQGAFLKRLLHKHKLRVYKLAGAAIEMAECVSPAQIDELLPRIRQLPAEGDKTQLGKGLRTVLNDLRGTPPSAVIILSDGITTDGEKLSEAAQHARRKGVPVFTVGLGDPQPVRDLELSNVQVDEVAFVGDPIIFLYTLTGRGYAGETATVVLREKDASQVLATRRVVVGADGQSQKLELTFTPPEAGEFDYALEAQPLSNETGATNNRQVRHISVRKEKIRVLLVDSLPRWEFRYLKNLLERDNLIELKTVLQEADPEFSAEDRTALLHFPVIEDQLQQYDVILFGDVNPAFLSTRVMKGLRNFVGEKGGGLLMIAGERHNPLAYRGTPLEDLLPVELATAVAPPVDAGMVEKFRPELTINGRKGTSIFRFTDQERDSLAVWNRLPELYWMIEAPQLKRGAIAFATHPVRMGTEGKLPVIAMHRFGTGKVIFHATDETWRWRFRVGDLYFGRYWMQAIRYLSRSKLIGHDRAAELLVDRREFIRGKPVQFRVNFLDSRLVPAGEDGVIVVVQRQGGPQRRIELTRDPQMPTAYEGLYPLPPEGSYHAFVATPVFQGAPPSADFRVILPPGEMRTVRMDLSELTRAADLTHGKYYGLTEVDHLLDAIPSGRPIPLETDQPVQLWNFWLTLMLFAALLGTEWILRKRWRLV